jgi:hypothetical protein
MDSTAVSVLINIQRNVSITGRRDHGACYIFHRPAAYVHHHPGGFGRFSEPLPVTAGDVV